MCLSGLMNLPNSLSLTRIFLVPLLVVVLLTNFEGRLIFGIRKELVGAAIFAFASLTDWLDGYLARRRQQVTSTGQVLDPLADKFLLVSIYIALGVLGALPSWLVIAVVSRDILIVIAVVLSWLLGNPVNIKPLIVSKANTVAQIVLAAAVLADEGFGLGIGTWREVLVWAVAALTIASLVAYMRAWLAHMAGYGVDGTGT